MSEFQTMTEFLTLALQDNTQTHKFFDFEALVSFVKTSCPKESRTFKITNATVKVGLLEMSKNHAVLLSKFMFEPFILQMGVAFAALHNRYPTTTEVVSAIEALVDSFGKTVFDEGFLKKVKASYNVRAIIKENAEWNAQMSTRRGALKVDERVSDFQIVIQHMLSSKADTSTLENVVVAASEEVAREETATPTQDPHEVLIVDFLQHILTAFVTDTSVINRDMLQIVAKGFLDTQTR